MSSRKKSCVPCRTSKARCSLESPCRRCDDRGLDCKYDHLSVSRRAAHRALRPLGSASEQATGGVAGQPGLEVGSRSLTSLGVGGARAVSATPGAHVAGPFSPTFHLQDEPNPSSWSNWDPLLDTPALLQSPSTCDFNLLGQGIQEMPRSPLRIPLDLSFMSPKPRDEAGIPWLQEAQSNALLALPNLESSNERPPPPPPPQPVQRMDATGHLRVFYNEAPFIPRPRKAVTSRFTSKVLLGQILSYPAMLVRGGRLPPFIFPPCVLDGQVPPAECCALGYHRCLPEELAICCNLVQSFENRTPGSAAFVWRSVYKEVERLRQEYMSFDREALLSCLQALLIYLLLQASDLESTAENDVEMLIETPVIIARRMYVLFSDYGKNLINGAGLSRREWVFRESIRRTTCLTFGFELLVDVDFGTAQTKCGGYDRVALPSGRYLWEPVSGVEWAARYRKMEAEIRKGPLIVRDLVWTRQAFRALGAGDVEEREIFSRVSEWCDGTDELGTLVWMALMMDD
ncbi:C6 finger domain-containing protein [Colletotrichum plurivorum]|uniref:C6 finger domain-containing protein n=1 Tax=Colletotrichum plurivorum TaxID=2175906 RepID=A0A8H6KXB2_9PEZI|nr:C6 finger domain-containing protein [Colletotrichum plurivorum]